MAGPVTSWQSRCGDGEAGYAPGESWGAGPARARAGGIHKAPVGNGQRRSGSVGGKSILRQAAWGPPSCGSWRIGGSRPWAPGRSTTGWPPAASRVLPQIQVGPQSCQLGVAGPGGREPCGGHGSGYVPWPESGHTRPLGRASQRGDAQGPVPQGFSGDLCPAVAGVTPWSGVPVSAAERPRPPKGGPFRQHTPGPYRVVPQRSGTEGGLKRWGLVSCPWCGHFTAAGGQPQGWGHSTRRPPLRRVPWVCPPA